MSCPTGSWEKQAEDSCSALGFLLEARECECFVAVSHGLAHQFSALHPLLGPTPFSISVSGKGFWLSDPPGSYAAKAILALICNTEIN